MSRKLLLLSRVVVAALVSIVAANAQGPQPQMPQAALGIGFSYQG